MKLDRYLIFFFVFIFGVLAIGVKYNIQEVVLSTALGSSEELLSAEYVKENILSSTGEFEEGRDTYVFNNETHAAPVELLRTISKKTTSSRVLGATTEEKRIIVDLEHQRVYAYEGDRLVFNFLVSTGLWGRTPPGTYKIWYKVRSQTMKGGSQALGTYYYLPNVQFIQYFNNGIGFHSTYWHNNFGNPMSHGCVNMTLTDSETLYYWATPTMPPGIKFFRSSVDNPGTTVQVVDTWTI